MLAHLDDHFPLPRQTFVSTLCETKDAIPYRKEISKKLADVGQELTKALIQIKNLQTSKFRMVRMYLLLLI